MIVVYQFNNIYCSQKKIIISFELPKNISRKNIEVVQIVFKYYQITTFTCISAKTIEAVHTASTRVLVYFLFLKMAPTHKSDLNRPYK